MAISLTELRQHLFRFADAVVDTGEPLVIERRGVRLRLMREEPTPTGRLKRLRKQDLVIGEPLLPSESPARWSETDMAASMPAVRVTGRRRR